MLIIEHLTVSYGEKVILKDLSVSFRKAHIHGLVGLNGSGKTTLLNTLYGIKRPDSGSILYKDAPLRRVDLSYLETENYFYSNITGREYLSLFKSPDGNYPTETWNQLFQLPLDNLVDRYSTGMKKKLALMATLKQDKPIVILDEPFNGLDIEASKVLSMVVAKLAEKGRMVIITSHILESLMNICDDIHYLNNQKIQFSRTKDNFDNIENEVFRDLKILYSDIINTVI